MNRVEWLAGTILETVRELGKRGAPNGIVYSGLMGMVGYSEYNAMIAALKKANLIEERNHVLYPVEQK